MTWILLEGLDRSGKSTVAEIYKKQGFDVVHMEAPDKKYFQPGYAGPSYLEEVVNIYNIYEGRDVLFDRTIYGEKIWPEIYNRQPLLTDEDLDYLQRLEYNNDTNRILMYDEDQEAHWQRCVDNKEPLNRLQFVQAGRLYDDIARKYNFERRQLGDFSIEDAGEENTGVDGKEEQADAADSTSDIAGTIRQSGVATLSKSATSDRTLEEKLERANAIRGLLGAPIVRKKGEVFQNLDKEIKAFLEKELEEIFTEPKEDNFTQDEVQILKIYAQRIKDKLG